VLKRLARDTQRSDADVIDTVVAIRTAIWKWNYIWTHGGWALILHLYAKKPGEKSA